MKILALLVVLFSSFSFCADEDGVIKSGSAFERERADRPAALPDASDSARTASVSDSGKGNIDYKNGPEPSSTPMPKSYVPPRPLHPLSRESEKTGSPIQKANPYAEDPGSR